MQRRVEVCGDNIWSSASLKQQLHSIHITLASRYMQRRLQLLAAPAQHCSCNTSNTTFTLMRSSHGCLRFYKYFVQRKAVVVLRKVTKGLHFDCSQYGSLTVFETYLPFPAVVCDWRTAENHDLNCISVKVVHSLYCFQFSSND